MTAPDFQSEPVAHYSVEAIETLAHIGGSKSHVNPGCRSESKHRFRILPVPLPLDAAASRQSPASTRCAAPWPIPPPLRMDFHDPLCRSHQFTLTRTSLLRSLWISRGLVRSRLSPRCNVLSLIPWIRQNSPRDRPLVPNSPTSRWTSCRVRRRRGLTSSGSVIRPLQQIPPRNGRCG
jgi:hypothetical protein